MLGARRTTVTAARPEPFSAKGSSSTAVAASTSPTPPAWRELLANAIKTVRSLYLNFYSAR